MTLFRFFSYFLIVLSGWGLSFEKSVEAAPIRSTMQAQKITIKTKRIRGSGVILKDGIQPSLLSGSLEWEYIPETYVSVPFVSLKLGKVPVNDRVTLLVEKTDQLRPNPLNGYVVRLPLLKKDNSVSVTAIDANGQLEEWELAVHVDSTQSAVFVDENCKENYFKIKELKRTADSNLIYVGCRTGAGNKELSLDVLWGDVNQVEYLSQRFVAEDSVLTIPLESRHNSDSDISGVHSSGEKSTYKVSYLPYQSPSYELWLGLAFFRNTLGQSNVASQYTSHSSAFLGQFWYRPEEVPFSLMIRGFGSLYSYSDRLAPVQNYKEKVKTYFLDAEVRVNVLNSKGWRVDPFLGGWFFFQDVRTRSIGVQRIICPVLGLVFQRNIGKRDSLGLTTRIVPLQNFFNPLAFKKEQSYIEFELTYVHPLRRRNRVFATLYKGNLNYATEGFAALTGSYLVLGGGYGW